MKQVQCSKAGITRACDGCTHREPHEPEEIPDEDADCTKPGPCTLEFATVRVECKVLADPILGA